MRSLNADQLRYLDQDVLHEVNLENIRDLDSKVIPAQDLRSLNTIGLDDDGAINPMAACLE